MTYQDRRLLFLRYALLVIASLPKGIKPSQQNEEEMNRICEQLKMTHQEIIREIKRIIVE